MSDHFPLDNSRHERPISALYSPPLLAQPGLHLANLLVAHGQSGLCVYPHAKGAEEIAESLVIRQVLKAISLACFARVAWRQPGGKGNNEA